MVRRTNTLCFANARASIARRLPRFLAPVLLAGSLLLCGAPQALAISSNNSIVVNSLTALPPAPCTGQTQIATCIKMAGTLNVVAGLSTSSPYSIDEIAFIKDSVPVGAVSPKNFTGSGTASAGTPINSSTLMCYVLDVNAGAPGVYPFTCEMTNLVCNSVYRYHFAASHTTAGSAEHSNTNTSATSMYGHTTPCAPSSGSAANLAKTTATVTATLNQGSLSQDTSIAYGTTSAYGSMLSLAAVASGTSTTVVNAALTGLTCETTYHYQLRAQTNDTAVNGSVTSSSPDATFTTVPCLTSQIITFAPPSSGIAGDTVSLSASASSSLAVTLSVDSSSTAGACAVSGASLALTAPGTCVVNADQAGDSNYLAAPQVQASIAVAAAPATTTTTTPNPNPTTTTIASSPSTEQPTIAPTTTVAAVPVVVVEGPTTTAPVGPAPPTNTTTPTPVPSTTATTSTLPKPVSIVLASSTVNTGAELTVTGTGYLSGSKTIIELHSDPIVLGTAIVNDDGTFTFTTATPDGIVGEHRIVVKGTSAGNQAVTSDSAITITTPAATVDQLALTGTSAMSLILVGAMLIVAGFVLRHRAHTTTEN